MAIFTSFIQRRHFIHRPVLFQEKRDFGGCTTLTNDTNHLPPFLTVFFRKQVIHMYTFFILVLFLWYFYYFYWSLSDPAVKPQHGSPNKATPYEPRLEYSSLKNKFRFLVYNRVAWDHKVPDNYMFRKRRLVEQDMCHGVADGGNVLATGIVLYQYLRDHPHLQPPHFKNDAGTNVVRTGNVFYFTCHKQQIQKLNQCPSGQVFVNDHCQVVTPCTDQEDGVLLPTSDPKERRRYLYCEGGQANEEECPTNTFFLLDGCRSQRDLSYYCQFTNESFLLEGSKTRIECVNGQPIYNTCPEGYKFFENECEPTTCEEQVDGSLWTSNEHIDESGTFSYYSGYMQCSGGRVSKAVECPSVWDVNDPSNVDNLLHLPMVFDGHQCAIPTFCINVYPIDGKDTIVPVYEWRRHVANWFKSSEYDHLEGYQCGEQNEGSNDPMTKRKRVTLSPGHTIHPKRFKSTKSCNDSDNIFLPVVGSTNTYFNCANQSVETCPPGEIFNGNVCQPPLSHPFRFQGKEIFQLDSLSHDNWIVPWKYVPKGSSSVICEADKVENTLYNICSDPECVHYPFLSQISSFSVYHPKGYRCYYDATDRHLKKENIAMPASFDFWSQHRKASAETGDCQMGQRLKTGHFVWDNTFYATCDPNQPFVFCPSSETSGIVKVGSRYACQLPPEKQLSNVFGETLTTAHFELNEIARIYPTRFNQEIQTKKDGPWEALPAEGMVINKALELTVREPVVLHYRYRVTHPPDVVFHHQEHYKASSHGGGFLCRRADFTHRNLTFPEYKVQAFLSDFKE